MPAAVARGGRLGWMKGPAPRVPMLIRGGGRGEGEGGQHACSSLKRWGLGAVCLWQ